MIRPSTKQEILASKSLRCNLLTDGFESRYGHVKIFKDKQMNKYSLVKDFENIDLREFDEVNQYLQARGVNMSKYLTKLESVSRQAGAAGEAGMTIALQYFPKDLQQDIELSGVDGSQVVI